MNIDLLYQKLSDKISPGRLMKQEDMKRHTSFKIGGPADLFINAGSMEEIAAVIQYAEEYSVPVTVIGNGTNLLVLDGGIRGVVLRIGERFSQVKIEGNRAIVQSGASLTAVAKTCAKAGLSGLEFACGIPGTVGGAVAMNAGAYGGEIRDVLASCKVLSNGKVLELPNEKMEMGYRRSILKESDMVVLEVTFALTYGEEGVPFQRCMEFVRRRGEKQPVEMPSAGSTFQRPPEGYASALIDQAGLKGCCVGGAEVSPKHAGFIVNRGSATAKDVLALMKLVQERVKTQFGVTLVPEVKVIGEEGNPAGC